MDDLQKVAVHEKGQSLKGTYVVFDLETTGFSAIQDKINLCRYPRVIHRPMMMLLADIQRLCHNIQLKPVPCICKRRGTCGAQRFF